MQRLLALAKNKFSEHDYQCVVYALEFAEKAHEGQNRLSGELYITHPIETAIILLELGMDPSTVISAILHDVLEDTKVSEGELKQKFGEQILNLVIGVTKISKIRYTSEKKRRRKISASCFCHGAGYKGIAYQTCGQAAQYAHSRF